MNCSASDRWSPSARDALAQGDDLARHGVGLGLLGRRHPGVQSGLRRVHETAPPPTGCMSLLPTSHDPCGRPVRWRAGSRVRPRSYAWATQAGLRRRLGSNMTLTASVLVVLRFSTCHDGLLAPAPLGCRQASPSSEVRPKTQPHSWGEAVHAGCSSRTLRHFWQHCRKCTHATLRHATPCPLPPPVDDDPGSQPLCNQLQHPAITDTPPDKTHQHLVVHIVEEALDVGIDEPTSARPAPP